MNRALVMLLVLSAGCATRGPVEYVEPDPDIGYPGTYFTVWTPPVENVDGSKVQDLAEFRTYAGYATNDLVLISVFTNGVNATPTTNHWYMGYEYLTDPSNTVLTVTAVDFAGNESGHAEFLVWPYARCSDSPRGCPALPKLAGVEITNEVAVLDIACEINGVYEVWRSLFDMEAWQLSGTFMVDDSPQTVSVNVVTAADTEFYRVELSVQGGAFP